MFFVGFALGVLLLFICFRLSLYWILASLEKNIYSQASRNQCTGFEFGFEELDIVVSEGQDLSGVKCFKREKPKDKFQG